MCVTSLCDITKCLFRILLCKQTLSGTLPGSTGSKCTVVWWTSPWRRSLWKDFRKIEFLGDMEPLSFCSLTFQSPELRYHVGEDGWDEKGRYSRREKTARYLARRPKWRSGVRRKAFLLLSEERPEAKGRQFILYFYRCMLGTNAPQYHSHKHKRRHPKPSHGWLLNTDNSCTCTRSGRGVPLSQSTFARSHKEAARICHPPSVCLHLLPFFQLSNAWIKRNLWPLTKKEDNNSNNNTKKANLYLSSVTVSLQSHLLTTKNSFGLHSVSDILMT